jgi:hypothetical protein
MCHLGQTTLTFLCGATREQRCGFPMGQEEKAISERLVVTSHLQYSSIVVSDVRDRK